MVLQAVAVSGLLGAYYLSLRPSARHAVIMSLPVNRTRDDASILMRVSDAALKGHPVAEIATGRVDLDCFDREQVAHSPIVRGDRAARLAKRASDIALGLALIVFTLPVLVLTALAIRVSSDGPVFYRQTRVGRGGRHFEIYKFRSMRTDAEADGVRWAGKNDCRITPVGRFIRATRIDEIPQAINIIRGEMSFVGPRPERPHFTTVLAEQIPHYDERHRVKPGLTGWAQVNYHYGASVEDAVEKLRYDLYYLKNHSLLLDLFIILRTLVVAVRGTGSR